MSFTDVLTEGNVLLHGGKRFALSRFRDTSLPETSRRFSA